MQMVLTYVGVDPILLGVLSVQPLNHDRDKNKGRVKELITGRS